MDCFSPDWWSAHRTIRSNRKPIASPTRRWTYRCRKHGREATAARSASAKVDPVQTRAGEAAQVSGTEAPPIVREALNSPGQPLDAATRAFFEPRLGRDFSEVRVHADSGAAAANQSLDAQAFAVGNRIAFGPGEFAPHTASGRSLLAHELAHVMQKDAGPVVHRQTKDKGKGKAGASKPKAEPTELTDEQIEAACGWAQTALGEEAIRELQAALAVPVTGSYDEETAKAVFARQREWKIDDRTKHPGQATKALFQRLGLLSTRQIAPAAVADGTFTKIKSLYPDGITVAVSPLYAAGVDGRKEFADRSADFAKEFQAVGLSKGNLALGVAVYIDQPGDVIESVQSIHRGLLAKSKAEAAPAGSTAAAPSSPKQEVPLQDHTRVEGAPIMKDPAPPANAAGAAPEEPAYTKIKNLAIFVHGDSRGTSGLGLEKTNAFNRGGLHANDEKDNPENLTAFVRGLSGAVSSGMRVELYACLVGSDPHTKAEDEKISYAAWTEHPQGKKTGAGSFAAKLSELLGPDSSVYGHTTAGHTTENFAARVFGKESGDGAGGLHMFDVLYSESFVQSELERLFPDMSEEDRADRHDSLRELMWAHYKDSISTEHARTGKDKRYDAPIGREMFIDPKNAEDLLHADWSTWSASRLDKVKPAKKKKKKT